MFLKSVFENKKEDISIIPIPKKKKNPKKHVSK